MKRIPASEKMRKELLKGVEAEKFLSSEILRRAGRFVNLYMSGHLLQENWDLSLWSSYAKMHKT